MFVYVNSSSTELILTTNGTIFREVSTRLPQVVQGDIIHTLLAGRGSEFSPATNQPQNISQMGELILFVASVIMFAHECYLSLQAI